MLFPLEVSVRKPTDGTAFTAAKAMIAQVEADAEALNVGRCDIHGLSIRDEVEPKGGVLVQLTCALGLTLDGAATFWVRAEAITRTLDLIQKYCEPGKDSKDVAVYTGPAQHASESTAAGT